MIYLDYAATTPMSEQSLKVYSQVASEYFGNPSSLHDTGSTAKQILEKSREDLAQYINGEARGIYFTGGGSDSNHLAIRSLINGNKDKKHLITTKLEHSSLLNVFKMLETEGYTVTYLSVDKYGKIDNDELKKAITNDTLLASIHHANSEIGTVQDIETIGSILKEHDVLFHSDCVQTFGKESIDILSAKLDSISMSSHKIYGPKGVGACYIRPSVTWKPVIPNTSHESGFRPGTVNVPGIAAFVTAADELIQIQSQEKARMEKMRGQLLSGLKRNDIDITIEGHPVDQLPHIIGIRIHGVEGQYVMLESNRYGMAISTGSACSVGKQAPSKTMVETGKNHEDAKEFIRLSLGKYTTEEDIDEVIKTFAKFYTAHFSK